MIKTEHYTENSNVNSKYKIQTSQNLINSNDELKQLWVACYFERRISKPLVQAMDLKHTVRVMRTLVDQGNIDFRTVVPLMMGLAKILQRKFSYLLNESQTTLESLKNPFADEVIDDHDGGRKEKSAKKKGDRSKREPGFAHPRPKNYIDLTNVKYPGIDNQVMAQIQEALEQDYKDFYMRNGVMKQEQDSVMHDIDEIRAGGMPSAIKREDEEDIRNMPARDFLQDISALNLGASPIPPNMDDELRNQAPFDIRNQYESHLNMTADIFNLMQDQLQDDLLPMDLPQDDYNQQEDQMSIFFNEEDMQMQDGSVEQGEKKPNKRQVQQIRQQMMKYDRKIQMQRIKPKIQQAEERMEIDDEDITKNMANLILNKGSDGKGWERSMMSFDTTANSNVLRSNFMPQGKVSLKKDRVSNQLAVNPAMETFLSFNLPQAEQSVFMRDEQLFGDQSIFGGQGYEPSAQPDLFQSPSAFGTKSKQFPEMTPHNLQSREFQHELENFEHVIKKRSEQTYSNIKKTMEAKQTDTMNLKTLITAQPMKDGQNGREKALQVFTDLLFLNQDGRVKMEQERPLEFTPINIRI